MLDGTTWPVERIARELGYDDAFYFSRLFRSIMGCTPKAYRKKVKGQAGQAGSREIALPYLLCCGIINPMSSRVADLSEASLDSASHHKEGESRRAATAQSHAKTTAAWQAHLYPQPWPPWDSMVLRIVLRIDNK